MPALSSGLPERVGDDEDLARFLTQSSHYNAQMARPAAFLPHPRHKNTSVFRYGNEPELLRKTWNETATGDRVLKAVAICKAKNVRDAQLDAMAAEPPPAHANIEGWPWMESDPELQKAKQLELASQIAKATIVVRM